MNVYRSFVKDNWSVLLGHLLTDIRGIILMPLIIKTVGVSIYGGYALLASLLGIVFGISSFGVNFRCKRYLPSSRSDQNRRELFYPQLYFQVGTLLFFSFLLIVFDRFVKQLFFKGEVEFSIIIGVLYLFTYMFFSQTNDYLRYTGRITKGVFQSVAFSYLHIIFILSIYFSLHIIDINLLIGSQALAALLISLSFIFVILKEIGFVFITYNRKNLIKDIKLGFPLVLAYIVDVILYSSDRYVIAYFMTVTAVGYYNPGYALGGFIALFPKAFGMVLPQFISKSVDQGRKEEAQLMLNYTLKGFLIVAIPFCVGCAVLSKPLLILLANPEVAEKSKLVAPIVALGTLFYGMNAILSNVLFVLLKTATIFKMNLTSALLNLVLNVVLLYFFRNILIAAITTFVSYFIVFIFIRRSVLADWPVDFHFESVMKSIAASLLMGAILIWMSSALGVHALQITYVLAEIAFCIIFYFAVLFAFGTFSQKELLYMRKVFYSVD